LPRQICDRCVFYWCWCTTKGQRFYWWDP